MGSLSEVDLVDHVHAFDEYSVQDHKTVCVELPSRKHVLHKPLKASKFHKMLIATLFKIHVQ